MVRDTTIRPTVFRKGRQNVGFTLQRDVERLVRYERAGQRRPGSVLARSAGVVLEKAERDGENDHAKVFPAVENHLQANTAQR